MMSDSESIAMGGGDHTGLFVTKDIMLGFSGISETYNNPQLSYSNQFHIIDFEVWALD